MIKLRLTYSSKSALLALVSIFSMITIGCRPVQAGDLLPVEKIVDGDTVHVRFPHGKESIRLIGIDAPESHENERAFFQARKYQAPIKKITALGGQATQHLRGILPRGTRVRIEYDKVRRDRYGRLLAYVYRADGVMLNLRMIDDGFSSSLEVKPNTRYSSLFATHLQTAQREQRGIWATLRSEQKSRQGKNSSSRPR